MEIFRVVFFSGKYFILVNFLMGIFEGFFVQLWSQQGMKEGIEDVIFFSSEDGGGFWITIFGYVDFVLYNGIRRNYLVQ